MYDLLIMNYTFLFSCRIDQFHAYRLVFLKPHNFLRVVGDVGNSFVELINLMFCNRMKVVANELINFDEISV